MAEEVKTAAAEGESGSKNFIDAFIEEDIAEGGRFQGQQVHTRFRRSRTAICTSATARR